MRVRVRTGELRYTTSVVGRFAIAIQQGTEHEPCQCRMRCLRNPKASEGRYGG